MKRIGLLIVVMMSGLLAGCNKGGEASPGTTPSGTAAPSASARPSASPSTSAAQLIEFTVEGAGPYQLGLSLAVLQTKPGLDDVTTGSNECPNNTFARGTGVWKDVRLSFRPDGKLYLLVNRSEAIPTPSGVYLGAPLADVKRIYANVMAQDLTNGDKKAFLVQTLSGGGILFDLGPGDRVMTMSAGDAGYLRSTFNTGSGFC